MSPRKPQAPRPVANGERRRAGELVEAIRRGDAAAREAAIDALDALSRETGDPDIWQSYAYGLDAAGNLEAAVQLLEWLVDLVPGDPRYTVHLARVRNARGERDRARHLLRAVLAGNAPEGIAALARLELAMLVAPGPVTVHDHRAMERQRLALRARIEHGQATAEDAIRLARLAGEQRRIDHDGGRLFEAVHALEDALKRSPGHPGLLDHLVLVRFLTGSPRAEETLAELRRLAPHSPTVQVFDVVTAMEPGPAADRARLAELIEMVANGDVAARTAAVEELGDGVARSPDEAKQRTFYAVALHVAGREPEALAQAEIGAQLAGKDAVTHYGLGSVFMRAGERGRAKHHLKLARKYASSAEDRADIGALLALIHEP